MIDQRNGLCSSKRGPSTRPTTQQKTRDVTVPGSKCNEIQLSRLHVVPVILMAKHPRVIPRIKVRRNNIQQDDGNADTAWEGESVANQAGDKTNSEGIIYASLGVEGA